MVTAFGSDTRIVASAYSGTIGVPALFGAEHVPELLRLSGDHGAGHWLRDRSSEVTAVAMDAAAVDIDFQADASGVSGSERSDADASL